MGTANGTGILHRGNGYVQNLGGVKPVGGAGGDGVLIETGPAAETPAGSGRWVYPATVDVPDGTTVRLTITANDRPGNTAVYEAEVTA
jgi:hypothetical protein